MSNLGDMLKSLCGTAAMQRGGLPTIRQAFDIETSVVKAAADAMATDATADTLFWSNPFDFPIWVTSGNFVTTAAGLTANNTNFANLLIKTNDGVGGATATALSMSTTLTDSGTFSTSQPKTFTLRTAANVIIPANGGLWFAITKTAGGVVVPAGIFRIRLQKAE